MVNCQVESNRTKTVAFLVKFNTAKRVASEHGIHVTQGNLIRIHVTRGKPLSQFIFFPKTVNEISTYFEPFDSNF